MSCIRPAAHWSLTVRPLSILSLLALSACGVTTPPRAASSPDVATLDSASPGSAHSGSASPAGDGLALSGSTGALAEREAPRRVGDRMVHRYSGTYRAEELVLAEEVVAEEGDLLVVDYHVLAGKHPVDLRVRMHRESERVESVAKLDGDAERPATLEDYENLLAQTVFSADVNRGLVSRAHSTCLVGPSEIDCVESRFDVALDGQPATLLVSRNPILGRDIGGEVTLVDGTVLYKVDLLEVERGPVPAGSSHSVALGETPDWARR